MTHHRESAGNHCGRRPSCRGRELWEDALAIFFPGGPKTPETPDSAMKKLDAGRLFLRSPERPAKGGLKCI